MADLSLSKRAINALARSEQMKRAMVAVAEDGAQYAVSIAPVDEGEYRDSFFVQGVSFGESAGAILFNDAPHGFIVERGTPRQAGFNVLSQVADRLENG